MKTGTWINGKRKLSGRWVYNWSANHFVIYLDSVDRITGRERCFRVFGDKPEWGNWKLIS